MSTRSSILRAGSLALLAGAAPYLAGGCGGSTATPEGTNLLLITVDTLRADHLTTYGHDKATSPHVDRLASAGVVFDDAQAHASWTLPTMASLMTGQLPSTHGCFGMQDRLDDSFPTLAEVLGDAGWTTAGVPSHTFVGSRFGFGQGFEHFDEELVAQQAKDSHLAITSEAISEKAIRWLREHANDRAPFFLWLHYFDPHEDYLRHDGLTGTVVTPGEKDVSLYDGEILYTDGHLGRLFDVLDELDLFSRTVVVFTADHGEEFGDHGGYSHGSHLHDEVVRVPLIVRAPGFPPRRVTETVRIIDVLPTALELLDVATPDVGGESLVPAMYAEPIAPRPAVGELRLRKGKYADSLTRGRWKLIVSADREKRWLYDRDADPAELNDLAATEPERVLDLLAELELLIASAKKRGAAFTTGAQVDLSKDDERMLEDLGYAGDDDAPEE